MTKIQEEKIVTTTKVNDRNTSDDHYNEQKTVGLYKFHQVIWFITGIIETLLGFRIILKLMAANPISPFTAFIYDISYPFAYPFLGIVRSPAAPNGFVFEWSSLIGMLVYAAVAYLIVSALQLLKPISVEKAEEAFD